MLDLYGARVGQTLALPLGGRPAPFFIAGVWRDYANQSGSVVVRLADYRALTGAIEVTDAAIYAGPGASVDKVERALRKLPFGPALQLARPGEIRAMSLQIFDRSFAVTYLLEAIAIVIGLPMLRLKGHYLALATLGFNVSFVIVATNWKSVMGGTDGISGIPSIALPGWPIANDHRYYYVLWVALAAATWCAWRIRNSHIGLAMIAVRDDEIATGAASVGVTRIKLQAFALSALYAGLAGALFAMAQQSAYPNVMSLHNSGFVVMMVLIGGGLVSFWGPAIGAVFFILARDVLGAATETWLLWYGLLFVVMVLFQPEGVAGMWQAARRRAAPAPARGG